MALWWWWHPIGDLRNDKRGVAEGCERWLFVVDPPQVIIWPKLWCFPPGSYSNSTHIRQSVPANAATTSYQINYLQYHVLSLSFAPLQSHFGRNCHAVSVCLFVFPRKPTLIEWGGINKIELHCQYSRGRRGEFVLQHSHTNIILVKKIHRSPNLSHLYLVTCAMIHFLSIIIQRWSPLDKYRTLIEQSSTWIDNGDKCAPTRSFIYRDGWDKGGGPCVRVLCSTRDSGIFLWKVDQ